jgi:hypothetical protein
LLTALKNWIPDQKTSGMTGGVGVSALLAFTSYYLLATIPCPCSWIPDQKTSGMTGGVGVSVLLAFTSYYLLSAALCFPSVLSVPSVVQRLSLLLLIFSAFI